jgi:glycosyltransferase involved in cell wall biosynthesis
MRIGLVIATHKRATLVGELLKSIVSQSRLPDVVLLSAVESSDVPEIPALSFPVKVLLGQVGSCKQRNIGIEYLAGCVDVIVFLDDDFWMAISYLEFLPLIVRSWGRPVRLSPTAQPLRAFRLRRQKRCSAIIRLAMAANVLAP